MTPKKKDLEIVCNLQWKNKPVSGDEKSNMVGMCDIPATTLTWSSFKSYLLKNSGIPEDDVKVSYVNSDDREIPITSQLDFQIALYSFRQRAMMGEIITLKLDRIAKKKSCTDTKKQKLSADVEVQGENKSVIKTSTDEPPEWFLKYMKKFKDDMVEEIAAACSAKLNHAGLHHSRKSKIETYKRIRKAPVMVGEINNERDIVRSSKLENKIESKLEKLENKTMKLRAKKMALKGSSDSDVGRGNGKPTAVSASMSDTELLMNAFLIRQEPLPHLSGGEKFLQKWDVFNNGKLSWTKETEFVYAWGSQALTPVDKSVPCPLLNPGEMGTITVLMDIPKSPGTYESYWHFHHKGKRFGPWLDFRVIVDEPPIKDAEYFPAPEYDIINIKDIYELVLPSSWTSSPGKKSSDENSIQTATVALNESKDAEKLDSCTESTEKEDTLKGLDYNNTLEVVNASFKNLKIETSTPCDSDNQSIISISDSNTSVNTVSSDEFVEIGVPKFNLDELKNSVPEIGSKSAEQGTNPIPTPAKKDNDEQQKIISSETQTSVKTENTSDELKNTQSADEKGKSVQQQEMPIDLSNKCDMLHGSNICAKGKNCDYAYIYFNGKKIPVLKKYLTTDYLTKAEDAPDPRETTSLLYGSDSLGVLQDSLQKMSQSEYVSVDSTVNGISHCSAAGSTYSDKPGNYPNSNRFFVFPHNYPGYEVINPQRDFNPINVVTPHSPHMFSFDQSNNMPFSWMSESNRHPGQEVLINNWSTGQNYSTYSYDYKPTMNKPPTYANAWGDSRATSLGSNLVSPNPFSPQRAWDNECHYEPNGYEKPVFNNINSPHLGNNTQHDTSYTAPNLNSFSSQNSLPQMHQTTTTPLRRVSQSVQRVPENLFTGAAIVATSAMNTARNVLNMFVPPKNANIGRWENGRWISTNSESDREKSLRILHEMGFYDRNLNASLLARYNDDLTKVIFELVQ